MILFTLRAPLSVVDGVVMLALFVLFLTYVAIRESRSDTPVFRDAELHEAYALTRAGGGTETGGMAQATARAELPPENSVGRRFDEHMPFVPPPGRSAWRGPVLMVLALVGLVVGAAATGAGTEGILDTYGLEGTLFGATIATVVLTVEDIFLTVEPARKGAPEIGVGNVIGSVVFSVTGKLGIILLAGGLVVGPYVLSWHLPALVVLTWVAAYFLFTGRLRRWHGFVLLGLYVTYWAVSFGALGITPVEAS